MNTTQYNLFDAGMFVMPDSPQCPLDEEDGPFEVLKCCEDSRTIFVRGHEHGIPTGYFRISHEGACSRAHIARCNADMDRWSERDRKLRAEWEATARGRTDEQRLLEHLGISHSEITSYLSDTHILDGGLPWHRLLIHLGIECLEGGYPYCEACFGSIRGYIQAGGSKEVILDRMRECNKRYSTQLNQQQACNEQTSGKGYMTRTGRIHTL
jgi:hypothetical protein